MWKYTGESIMNKKGESSGWNLTKLLEIILAVICIALIVYISFKWYDSLANQESKNAQNLIETLDAKIQAAQEGGAVVRDLVRNPDTSREATNGEWVLVGWNVNDKNRPDKCYFNNCVCVCKTKKSLFPTRNDQSSGINDLVSDCQQNGFCRNIDASIQVSMDKISSLTDLVIRSEQFFTLDKRLAEISITRSKNNILIKGATIVDDEITTL